MATPRQEELPFGGIDTPMLRFRGKGDVLLFLGLVALVGVLSRVGPMAENLRWFLGLMYR